MNRKAQGLSINVVIIVAIGLSVLLFVGTFLSGGFSSMSEKITTFGRESASAETSAKFVKCNTLCAAWVAQDCEENDLPADLKVGATENPCGCDGQFADCKTKCGCT